MSLLQSLSAPVSRRLASGPPRPASATCSDRSSRARSATRRPSDGQQGRLYIGFAAAELLGLMAFAVAMLILFAF